MLRPRDLNRRTVRSPAGTVSIFQRLTDPGFLAQAWRTVMAHYKEGALPAALAEFDRRRGANLNSLGGRIRDQKFLPQPAELIHIHKTNHPEEERPISLLGPEDRIVLTALATLLSPLVERQLLPGCVAYRPQRSASGAVVTVHGWIKAGCTHIATGDVDNFFATTKL